MMPVHKYEHSMAFFVGVEVRTRCCRWWYRVHMYITQVDDESNTPCDGAMDTVFQIELEVPC